ncbi:TfoX/Sxy family protein [Agarivorans sp. Alg241-V36]|uniref:TfoX/Sxy family protein n=1 Tax=Agarivorans sp. Alg241-V36 TaxID=2305992 RepID=UPI0013D29841|nr:TfoX/Sxy family protein [Agarivorans sp. Alg241-V36]
MAYDLTLAEMIRQALADKVEFSERKMFGGLCFMVAGHMCCGIVDKQLMARVGPNQYQDCLALEFASEMTFTGKPMKGMIYVAPEGLISAEQREQWLQYCLNFVHSLPPK